jgi:hypothetical protein
MGEDAPQRRFRDVRATTIADVLADQMLGVTVGGEELYQGPLVLGRLEARHPAFTGFFCLCLAHHATSPLAAMHPKLWYSRSIIWAHQTLRQTPFQYPLSFGCLHCSSTGQRYPRQAVGYRSRSE